MEPKVTAIVSAPEPKTAQAKLPPKAAEGDDTVQAKKVERDTPKRDPEPLPTPDQVDTRLVIEMDRASGAYVYKTINRQTGEVMSQLPRAEVLKLRDGGDYAAGAVIRTKV